MNGYYQLTLEDIAEECEQTFGNRKDLLDSMTVYGASLFLASCASEMDVSKLNDANYWYDFLKVEVDDNGEPLGVT